MRAVRVWNLVSLVAAMSLFAFACASPPETEKKAADAGAANAKLAAIPAELDKWEADVTALATPKKDDKKPAAKK